MTGLLINERLAKKEKLQRKPFTHSDIAAILSHKEFLPRAQSSLNDIGSCSVCSSGVLGEKRSRSSHSPTSSTRTAFTTSTSPTKANPSHSRIRSAADAHPFRLVRLGFLAYVKKQGGARSYSRNWTLIHSPALRQATVDVSLLDYALLLEPSL